MDGLTDQEFMQISNCIEMAHKMESQKLSMVEGAKLAIELDRLRNKVRGFVAKPAAPVEPKKEEGK